MTERKVQAQKKPLTDADLQSALAAYSTTSQIVAAFAPIVHTHAISDVTNLQATLDGKAELSHTHGNITNAGAIGTTANLPLITTTSGVITTGSFGTTSGTFAQGNDSRIVNAAQTNAQNLFYSNNLFIGSLDVLHPVAFASNWWGFDATNGTTSSDGVVLNSRNNGTNFLFRRDGRFVSASFRLGDGPVLKASGDLITFQVRRGDDAEFAAIEALSGVFNGNVQSTALLFIGTYTVGTLPLASSNAGAFAQVTDSNSTTNGNTVAGGGANRVPVFSNGTNWIIK